jgi:hypothetical protein
MGFRLLSNLFNLSVLFGHELPLAFDLFDKLFNLSDHSIALSLALRLPGIEMINHLFLHGAESFTLE